MAKAKKNVKESTSRTSKRKSVENSAVKRESGEDVQPDISESPVKIRSRMTRTKSVKDQLDDKLVDDLKVENVVKEEWPHGDKKSRGRKAKDKDQQEIHDDRGNKDQAAFGCDKAEKGTNRKQKQERRSTSADMPKVEATKVRTRARLGQKKVDDVTDNEPESSLKQTSNVSDRNTSELQEEAVIKVIKAGKRKRNGSSPLADQKPSKGKKSKVEVKEIDECHESDVKLEPCQKTEISSAAKKFVGAHTSIAGGLSNAIKETLAIGGRAFGMFLKSQRTWNSKPLQDSDVDVFKAALKESGILPQMVVPHGSYLLNCGSSDDSLLEKSRNALVDELKRCDRLGLPIYNFHPGSSKGEISRDDCIKKISETINYAHSQTTSVVTVIENMSCQGNTIGGKFSELRQIIDGVEDKSRVGVCLDTCHAFAAGYNIKSEEGYEQMKQEFDEVIGRNYLKAVHLNDSKGELGCHQDRHENIGKGKLGLATFRRIMNDPYFDDIPMVLETPEGDYGKEISKLYQLCEH